MMQKGLSLRDVLELILKRKWWLILIIIPGTAIAAAVSYSLPPVYRSSTVILVERQKVPEAYVKPSVASTIEDRLNTISQQIMSRRNLEKIVEKFHLYQQEKAALSQEEIFGLMRKDIEVRVMGKDAFTLAYVGSDPKTVMGVTNTLASLFIEENLKVREEQAEGTSEFLENELAEAAKQLEKQEKDVQEFKRRYMGALPEQMDANLRTLDRLQLELQSINEGLRNAEDRKIFYEKQLGEGNPDTNPDQLQTKLAKLKMDLSRLQAEFKDSYPDIVLLKKQISETEMQIQKESASSESSVQTQDVLSQRAGSQLQTTNSDIRMLKERQKKTLALINDFEKRVEATPANEQKLLTLSRDYDMSQKNYQTLLGKKLDAKVSENLEKRQKGEQFRILDSANLPERPYKPDRRKIMLFGFLLSVGASVGVIFLVEQLNQSFKSPEDLSDVINLQVLAIIPNIPKNKNNGGHQDNNKHRGLIAVREPSSMLAEQYRVLYGRIHQFNKKRSHNVFAVSSAVQDEGKTTTSLNLAVVMARDFGKRTLLIEGDCKNPSILKYLGMDFKIGLGDVLLNKKDVHLAMARFAHDNLWILPATRSVENSSGLLSSPAMADLVKMLKERYDYVLIDSPPILPLADMNIFAELVDGIILVVRAEKTSRNAVLQAMNSLATNKLIGVVLNDVRPPFLKDYRYEYVRKA